MTEIRSMALGMQHIMYGVMSDQMVDALFDKDAPDAPFAERIYMQWGFLERTAEGKFDPEMCERLEVFAREHAKLVELFEMAQAALAPVHEHEAKLFASMRAVGVSSFFPEEVLSLRKAYSKHLVNVFLKEPERFGTLKVLDLLEDESEDEELSDGIDEEEEGEEESEGDDDEGDEEESEGGSGSEEDEEESEADEDSGQEEHPVPPPLKRKAESDSENESGGDAAAPTTKTKKLG